MLWWSGTTFFLTFWVQVGPLFVTKSRSSPRAVKNFCRKILKKGNSSSKKKPFRCKSILTRVALKKSPKVAKVDDQNFRGVFKMEYRAQERLRNCRKVVFWKVTFLGGAITGEGLGTNGTFGAKKWISRSVFIFTRNPSGFVEIRTRSLRIRKDSSRK